MNLNVMTRVMSKGLAMGIILSSSAVFGQSFIEKINEDNIDFYQVRTATEAYFDTVGRGQGTGYKLFKRWEHHAFTRLQSDGKVQNIQTTSAALTTSRTSGRAFSGSWSEMGPMAWTNTAGYNPGVGRVTAISVEATSQNIIYVGSPGGGLWKSTNAGSSWTPKGDLFDNMTIWGVTIDPSNSNTVYVGNDAGDLYKSTDGGTTFSIIMNQSSGRVFNILVHPTNSNIMHVAVRGNGLFRTTDGGSTWSEVITVDVEDVIYKPGSTSTMYACGGRFYKSTDSGASWTEITSGFSSTERMKLAVSSANSSYVYVVQKMGGNFGYLYRSTDSGTNFSIRIDHTTAPEYIGNQASRDMAIAVSHTNAEEVHIGGFNMYKSTNGGTAFTQECDWYFPNTTGGGGSYAYVHADIEVMFYLNGNIYVGSDGGIFKSSNAGSSFSDLSTGLGVHQFYRINCSLTDKNRVIGGAQDNGTNVMSTSAHSWVHMMGADGMDCAVHPTNSNIVFGCTQYGGMVKSTNGGTTRTSMVTPPENGSGNWVTPIAIDANNGNRIYAGYQELYRHDNLASSGSWVTVSSGITFNAKLRNIELAPSNSNVIYVSTTSGLYKSSNILDATPTWTTLTGISGTMNDIAVDPYDEDRVVVVTSFGNVYESTDGGASWTNINTGLPSGAKTSCALDRSANKGIYVSIDGAVYFTNNTTSGWEPFSTSLPMVDTEELELFYGAAGENRLRIGTYGRGLWESTLFDDAEDGGSSSGLACSSTFTTFPYTESFESGTGMWSQGSGDDAEWTRQTGITGSTGTGPTSAVDGSYYMYFEVSSPNYPSKTTLLESDCFNLSSLPNPVLTFQYHMLGATVGSLDLEVTQDDITWTSLWSISADQGSAWTEASINLSAYTSGKVKFRFRAVSGSSFTGDIAIDKLNIDSDGITCSTTVSSYPYNESFESGLGGWNNVSGDDADWTRHTGSTGSTNTGPTAASDGSYYMYFEVSSPNFPTKRTFLESNCFNLNSVSNPELSFDYNMYGATVGSLDLEVSYNGVTWTSIWNASADQGTDWLSASVNINAYSSSTVKFRFNALSGSSYTGDIAIDKLNISQGSALACASTINSFPYSEGFESGIGTWNQVSGDDADWTNKTGTTPSSGTGPTAAAEGSYYMYYEVSSPNYPTKTTYMESACFDLSTVSNPLLTFQYHMLGTSIGTLALEASTDGTTWTSLWTLSGDQGTAWLSASVSLNAYTSTTVKLRFTGTSSTSWAGDLCVDDLLIATAPITSSSQMCMSLDIDFDQNPGEISWEIRQDGKVIQASGDYSSLPRGSSIQEEICVPTDCFEFLIMDSQGNGLCCHNGIGNYSLRNMNQEIILEGSDFTSSRSYQICEGEQTETLSSNGDTPIVKANISIFPNPANSIIHVQMPTKGETIGLDLYDLSGRKVLSQSFDTAEGLNLFKLNVEHLAAGTYVLQITQDKAQTTERIVLQH